MGGLAMKVFARKCRVPDDWCGGEAALLLEGSWGIESQGAECDSLDESIDARHGWIDADAVRIAEQLAEGHDESWDSAGEVPNALLAHLGALRLRYYLVKLLRWVAYCREVRRPIAGERWELHAGPGDQDYVDVFEELCRVHGVAGRVLLEPEASRSTSVATKIAPAWRRMLTPLLATTVERAAALADKPPVAHGRRVMFCGDGHLLTPVCHEWLRRKGQAALLCDLPIIKLRVRIPNLRQFACEGFRGRANRFDPIAPLSMRTEEGIDLGRPLERWLSAARAQHGPRWSRWLTAMDRHFISFRPQVLALSEDATPFARAAVWTAQRHGVPSLVVQHGAPCLSFGFAPLAADQIAAWDDASRDQLVDWGVPRQRIVITGSLALDQSRAQLAAVWPRRKAPHPRTVVLLANLPARDDRPDGVAYHLTRDTHEGMLRAALEALSAIPGVRLIVKLHPRQIDNEPWPRLLGAYPSVQVGLVRCARWTDLLRRSSLVLSCVSSAGIEAARLGWPVVQIVPRGAGNVLPAARWGLLGSASTAEELRPLVLQALQCKEFTTARLPSRRDTAASRIATEIERVMHSPRMTIKPQHVREESLCLPT